tara:strand:+ start:1426 stop:1656 length:231 start_codon:yes stop_codon:yes gene_type:complete
MELENNIKEYIKKSGYKSYFIADKIGCNPSDISRWISGERRPSRERLRRLSKLLRIPMKDLYPSFNFSREYHKLQG